MKTGCFKFISGIQVFGRKANLRKKTVKDITRKLVQVYGESDVVRVRLGEGFRKILETMSRVTGLVGSITVFQLTGSTREE